MTIQFFQEAIRQSCAREWRWLALGFFIVTTGTTALLLSHSPGPDESPSPIFIMAGIVRIAGVLLLSVAALRVATQSSRHPFLPDMAFFSYLILTAIVFALSGGIRTLLGAGPDSIATLALAQAIVLTLSAPLFVWTVALAVERPLAINPRPWFRFFVSWLTAMLIWKLLIIMPLYMLHAYINIGLLDGRIARSLLVETADGLLSVVMVLLSLALSVVAYRRVANR